jgi:hypothetical protein
MSDPQDPQPPRNVNFTVVPDDSGDQSRTYANFCAISHTPFDFTLTFCEVLPPTEQELRSANTEHTLKAPVRARIVVPIQFVPNLIAALTEHMRVFSESSPPQNWPRGPVH